MEIRITRVGDALYVATLQQSLANSNCLSPKITKIHYLNQS